MGKDLQDHRVQPVPDSHQSTESQIQEFLGWAKTSKTSESNRCLIPPEHRVPNPGIPWTPPGMGKDLQDPRVQPVPDPIRAPSVTSRNSLDTSRDGQRPPRPPSPTCA
ncbi:hypothetical protein HGM15179_021365 [Zosterops borbonicus]|uniref:Uncharacterized protein n=1 Tax=Zosterops borbonicus TaxID=364589 RepID=A0A8K1D605_9PASS|nr:hypothetical protein HGM15179_021365 [Zosterops borbonicus]